MKKQKDSKQSKRNALASFLESSTTSNATSQIVAEVTTKPVPEQDEAFQEYTQEFTNCNVCGCDLEPEKRKKCEFCSMPACNDHIRKRRKKKGKWQRICDHCEDKYLYDVFMKLQSKADEALAVQQQIITLKHENFKKEVQARRQQRRQIGFKTMLLQENYEKQITKISDTQNKLMSTEHHVQSLGLGVKQLEAFVERVASAFKDNNEESFNLLSQENNRMAKELTKLEKKFHEIKAAIEQRERDIENAFQIWSQKQFKKKLQSEEQAALKKKQSCQIF